jgi:hypothetical protein
MKQAMIEYKLRKEQPMKCFECPWMAYVITKEGNCKYASRWCSQCGAKCLEVWPKDCPEVKKETKYAEAMEAYDKRYSMGVEEYYAWHERTGNKPDTSEAADCAKKFAGPEPKMEDF